MKLRNNRCGQIGLKLSERLRGQKLRMLSRICIAIAILIALAIAIEVSKGEKHSGGQKLKQVSFSSGGTVKGVVKFEGQPPKPRLIRMKQDKNCEAIHKGKPILSEDFVLNKNGTLKWVLVYVKSGISGNFELPKEPAILDQQGCIYKPRVFGVMVGQPVEIRNSDPTFHNVHFVSKNNGGFNIGQPRKGLKTTKTFSKPELPGTAFFKCDVHPWMRAWIGIFEHPFFDVTGDDGSFTISGLPAGTYEVEAWHEKLGTQKAKVTLKAGETVTVNFLFKSKIQR